MSKNVFYRAALGFLGLLLLLNGCTHKSPSYIVPETAATAAPTQVLPTSTPFTPRPVYAPGTQVDYIAQSGDTLELLSSRFGSSVAEIRLANPQIPEDATTMPPGFPMKMPIYYEPLWGPQYQIIPDAAFVYGPDLNDFDLPAFLQSSTGWFKTYETYIQDKHRTASDLIMWLAQNYSLSPKLFLALIEYQTGAITNPVRQPGAENAFLGWVNQYRGVYLQLYYVGDLLNDGFYRYANGELSSIEHLNGELENIDPWQNAASVALQTYFARFLEGDAYLRAVGPDGFAATFRQLFGDPWERDTTVIPGSLHQPAFILPFQRGTTWAYTGGPHTGWGRLKPWAAIDFAPPMNEAGCVPTEQYTTAVADGIVARVDDGIVILDLDGDGNERTGWNILYLHVATADRIKVGTRVKQGDPLGHPSCEGGMATGTHIHIARKFNGQWMPAAGYLPFDLAGWTPVEGSRAYLGTLVRGDELRTASVKSDSGSMVAAE